MTELESIEQALKTAPVRPLEGMLVRCVALLPLTEGGTPDYLFTSGKANRFNPAGVRCVYFSEDETTARLEYARRFGTSHGAHQPLGIYFAKVSLANVLDLADPATKNAFTSLARRKSRFRSGRRDEGESNRESTPMNANRKQSRGCGSDGPETGESGASGRMARSHSLEFAPIRG